jgi:hypothetical protein
MTRLESAVVVETGASDSLQQVVRQFAQARRAIGDYERLDLTQEDDAEYVTTALAIAERVYQLSQAVWPEVTEP